eukprot:4336360-Karenia_brevis.AAC.1
MSAPSPEVTAKSRAAGRPFRQRGRNMSAGRRASLWWRLFSGTDPCRGRGCSNPGLSNSGKSPAR